MEGGSPGGVGAAVGKMGSCLRNGTSVDPLDCSCQWEHPRRDRSVYNLGGNRLFIISTTYHLSLASAFLLPFNSQIAVLEFTYKLLPATEGTQSNPRLLPVILQTVLSDGPRAGEML